MDCIAERYYDSTVTNTTLAALCGISTVYFRKVFETVYGMVKKGEGAQPVADQLAEIRKNYEEYFNPQEDPAKGEQPKNTPQYSQQPGRTGTNPDSEEEKLYKALSEQWK